MYLRICVVFQWLLSSYDDHVMYKLQLPRISSWNARQEVTQHPGLSGAKMETSSTLAITSNWWTGTISRSLVQWLPTRGCISVLRKTTLAIFSRHHKSSSHSQVVSLWYRCDSVHTYTVTHMHRMSES